MADQSSSEVIQSTLQQMLAKHLLPGAKICLAYSGGLDSTVLMHALQQCAIEFELRAIHIDHGLQAASAGWAATCADIAEQTGVSYSATRVIVDVAGGKGIEAAARAARYQALRELLEPDEVLLTAHHQRDQVETLLLQMLRGAGVHGLAAMPVLRVDNGLNIFRPLLTVSADAIRAYGAENSLHWIEDPSNALLDMDRNYLRHEVLPLLSGRWNAMETAIARSSRLCAEAADIIDERSAEDLQGLLDGSRLSLSGLAALPAARQRHAFRFALRSCALPTPSEQQLTQALETLLLAKVDAQPEAAWPGARVRRYRDELWLFDDEHDPRAIPQCSYDLLPGNELDLGAVRGKLSVRPSVGHGIAADLCDQPLKVCFRQGGEKIRPAAKGRNRLLKNLLQETDIVPWMRGNIPLIYCGTDLLAVGDIWVNAEFAAHGSRPGFSIIWQDHAPLR